MLSAPDIERFTEVCTAIGNEIADERGFVSIRDLLRRFNADVIVRPLLVEGMLHPSTSCMEAALRGSVGPFLSIVKLTASPMPT